MTEYADKNGNYFGKDEWKNLREGALDKKNIKTMEEGETEALTKLVTETNSLSAEQIESKIKEINSGKELREKYIDILSQNTKRPSPEVQETTFKLSTKILEFVNNMIKD